MHISITLPLLLFLVFFEKAYTTIPALLLVQNMAGCPVPHFFTYLAMTSKSQEHLMAASTPIGEPFHFTLSVQLLLAHRQSTFDSLSGRCFLGHLLPSEKRLLRTPANLQQLSKCTVLVQLHLPVRRWINNTSVKEELCLEKVKHFNLQKPIPLTSGR